MTQQTAVDYWNRIIIDSNKLMKEYMEKNKQQTALDFFLMKLVDLEIGKTFYPNQHQDLQNAYKEAKQMDSELAFQLFKAGQDSMGEGGKNFEQYYNETFKK